MLISTKAVALAMLAPPCMACSLAPPDALLLKQAMAKEIAFRLAIKVEEVALADITAPQLQRPLDLGPDCSGLDSFHHSSGFRLVLATQQHAFATMAKPHTAAGAGARYRDRYRAGVYARQPWAGVQRNFWRVPRAMKPAAMDYSGYARWPQYPTEGQFAASQPAASTPQRWPQYPDPSEFNGQFPEATPQRWSTLGATPAKSLGQGICRYEGMAVVLGYDSASPVAVNFTQQCH